MGIVDFILNKKLKNLFLILFVLVCVKQVAKMAEVVVMLVKLLYLLADYADYTEWRGDSRHLVYWQSNIQIHKAWEKRLEDALRETTTAGLNDVSAKLSAWLEMVRSDLVRIVESLKKDRANYKDSLNKVQNQIKAWDLEREKGGSERTAQRADLMGLAKIDAEELDKVVAALKDLGVQDD